MYIFHLSDPAWPRESETAGSHKQPRDTDQEGEHLSQGPNIAQVLFIYIEMKLDTPKLKIFVFYVNINIIS